MRKKILIIGGVASGASAAARSRRLDENAEIIMFEKDPHVSFSNCGLPYHISGHISKIETLLLMNPLKFYSQYNIIAKVNHEVIEINHEQKTITVLDQSSKIKTIESYDELIIATGARAKKIVIPGQEKMPSFVLKNVVDLDKIMKHINENNPKHMTVVGGGYIGIEVAENLKKAGISVSLVEYMNQVLMPIDFEMVQIAHKELLDQQIDLKLNSKITKIDMNEITINDDEIIETNGIIFATGITPNSEIAVSAGISVNKTNHILVNERFETNIDHIYAVGDVIVVKDILNNEVAISLAGSALKQGRFVADAIYNKPVVNNKTLGSSVVQIFNLTVASTGMNEKQLKAHNVNYEVVTLMPKTAVGIMPEAKSLYLKVIFDRDSHLILGAQAISKGYGAEKRVDIISVFIKNNIKVQELIDVEVCYAPPYATGKDAVNFAGYIASNLIDNSFKQVQFYETAKLIKDNQLVIDCREENEFAEGHIKGAVNIPMSVFRERVKEIPRDKNIYVHCRSGQRSYNMCLFLQSQGYENVYNIAGSYAFMSNYYDTLEKLYGGESLLTVPIFN
ncbi:MAG: pyridine nucleotide-disulfide oxidoreductase [Mycoplasmataceae bacterium]|nr:pyridine nucleotide-disulfide oxidoreductase [Mycoplasmataceae bacterium]